LNSDAWQEEKDKKTKNDNQTKSKANQKVTKKRDIYMLYKRTRKEDRKQKAEM